MLHIKIPERPQKEEKSKFSVKADNRQSHSYATAKTRLRCAPLFISPGFGSAPPIPPPSIKRGRSTERWGPHALLPALCWSQVRDLSHGCHVYAVLFLYIYISHIYIGMIEWHARFVTYFVVLLRLFVAFVLGSFLQRFPALSSGFFPYACCYGDDVSDFEDHHQELRAMLCSMPVNVRCAGRFEVVFSWFLRCPPVRRRSC